MPKKAKKVRIVTVVNDEALDTKHFAQQLAKSFSGTGSTSYRTRSMPMAGRS